MRVLLAIDVDQGQPARLLNEAVFWARRLDATLDLAYVGRANWALGAAADPELRTLIAQEVSRQRHADQAALDALVAQLPKECRGAGHVLDGPPVQALVEASRNHAALLVGTHGRTGVERFWLGSISEQLVRQSVVPVVVLRLYTEE